MPAPIALTDDQLDAIMRACEPLRPADRGGFLEAVAAALQGRKVGDGAVYLAIRQTQRRFFDPPQLTDGRAQPQHRGARAR
jgi:hypothetical protein